MVGYKVSVQRLNQFFQQPSGMASQTNEQLFTDIYTRNAWGSSESKSGPTSSLKRTEDLRSSLVECFKSLNIQTVFDCGCGDWTWMQHVPLDGVEYLGADIVQPLIESLQKQFTKPTVHFQKMDILQEPPETADLWIARDFLNCLTFQQLGCFFRKFLESKSLYLAVSSTEKDPENSDGLPGYFRPLDFQLPPFQLKPITKILNDGQQWFSQRYLFVYSREAVQTWWTQNQHAFKEPTSEDPQQNTTDGTQDRNAHLKSNVLLKNYPIHGHMG
jgi:SAM-dependent methyltransferase